MDVKWPTLRCILCGSGDCITKEHLIPACLGGKLTAKFLCKDCNSTLGQGAESRVREDPTIRSLSERVVQEIPSLGTVLRKNLLFIGHSEQGQVPGYERDGKFIPKKKQLEDGSLIVPENESLEIVKTMADRDGRGPLLLTPSDLSYLPLGDSVEAAPGIWIKNWPVTSYEPDLNGPDIDRIVPTKIAFEFLALHCGNDIYENPPQLASIRRQLLTGELSEEDIRVERALVKREQLIHGLVFEGNKPGAQVQIRLFGQLAFRVQFRHLATSAPRCGYTHDLESGEDNMWRAG